MCRQGCSDWREVLLLLVLQGKWEIMPNPQCLVKFIAFETNRLESANAPQSKITASRLLVGTQQRQRACAAWACESLVPPLCREFPSHHTWLPTCCLSFPLAHGWDCLVVGDRCRNGFCLLISGENSDGRRGECIASGFRGTMVKLDG